MTRYLLDTNIISNVFKRPDGPVTGELDRRRGDEIGTSVIVVGEIRFGLAKNANLRAVERLGMLLRTITVWPMEPEVGEAYAEFRLSAVRSGVGIGTNDLWIAAHAAVLGATVVTDDRAFARIAGLTVENWLQT